MTPLVVLVASLTITAPWPNGGTIPRRYTCDGADRVPTLTMEAAPSFRTAAIEVVDIDAPNGHFVHWLALGRVEGRNSFGTIGWRGPCPPRGDPPHRYVFTLYELDGKPSLPRGFSEAQFLRAIRGHVMARGRIVGRYARR